MQVSSISAPMPRPVAASATPAPTAPPTVDRATQAPLLAAAVLSNAPTALAVATMQVAAGLRAMTG